MLGDVDEGILIRLVVVLAGVTTSWYSRELVHSQGVFVSVTVCATPETTFWLRPLKEEMSRTALQVAALTIINIALS